MANVWVEALEWHTCEGAEHPAGTRYEVDEALLATLIAQRKAVPVPDETPAAPPVQG